MWSACGVGEVWMGWVCARIQRRRPPPAGICVLVYVHACLRRCPIAAQVSFALLRRCVSVRYSCMCPLCPAACGLPAAPPLVLLTLLRLAPLHRLAPLLLLPPQHRHSKRGGATFTTTTVRGPSTATTRPTTQRSAERAVPSSSHLRGWGRELYYYYHHHHHLYHCL